MMNLEMGKKADMLTPHDVKQILEYILLRRNFTKLDIIQLIKRKHLARLSAKESHHRRNVYPKAVYNDGSNI